MKNYLSIVPAACALMLSVSCSSDNEPTQEPAPDPIKVDFDAGESRAMTASNGFGIDLFKSLSAAAAGENVVMSPLSVSMCLSLAANGASDQTMSEILSAMHYEGDNADALANLNSVNSTLMEVLPKTDPTSTVKLANSVWLADGYPVLPAYAETVGADYRATVQNVDFGSMAGIGKINEWVNRSTDGVIKQFFSVPQPFFDISLLNATYFKGTWKEPFKKSNTSKQTFNSADGTTVQVDMMTQGGKYDVSLTSDFTMLRKAFGNSAYNIFFLLPNEGKTADEVAASMSATSLQAALDNLRQIRADIYVPKTTVNNNLDLSENLKSLGINDLFSGSALNMISPQPFRAIEVSQMAYFAMDEDGVTAASVTGMNGDGAPLLDYIEFRLDRPFLFFIRESSTGAILFLGKINKFRQE